MNLFYKTYGDSSLPPLLVLHGLFGSHENWITLAKIMADCFHVFIMDARNHGNSEHGDEHSYPVMADDLVAFMQHQGIEKASVLGHSMGGKTAMTLALNHPQRVDRLIIVDIAPRYYVPNHDNEIEAMETLPLDSIRSRNHAEEWFKDYVDDQAVRLFLLKNLRRNEDGKFYWRMNLPVLKACYPKIAAEVQGRFVFEGETLFIKGGDSGYITLSDREDILGRFPNSRSKVIGNAGHWPHAQKPAVFNKIVQDFLCS